MHCVSHPATGLHLIRVQAPELELFFKQGTAYVSWIVKLSSPERIRVQHYLSLSKWSRDSTTFNALVHICYYKIFLFYVHCSVGISYAWKIIPVVVEYLCEYSWVPVEEIFVEHRIVVCQRLCKPRKSRGWDLLKCHLHRVAKF